MTFLRWIPYYFKTERKIFVHDGIDVCGPWLWQEMTAPYVIAGHAPRLKLKGCLNTRGSISMGQATTS